MRPCLGFKLEGRLNLNPGPEKFVERGASLLKAVYGYFVFKGFLAENISRKQGPNLWDQYVGFPSVQHVLELRMRLL